MLAKLSRHDVVSMQAPLTFRSTMVGFEKRSDNHIWFTIIVTSSEPGLPSKHYQIARTFRMFVQFSQRVREEYGKQVEKIPHLRPAKHFFSLSLMTPHQKFEELDRYLAQFSRLPKELFASSLARNFFGIRETDLLLNNSRLSSETILPSLIRSVSETGVPTLPKQVLEKLKEKEEKERKAKEEKEKKLKEEKEREKKLKEEKEKEEKLKREKEKGKQTTFALPPPSNGNMKRSRSLSVRPLIDNARSALTRHRSVMVRAPSTSSNSSNSSTPDESLLPTAPWNRVTTPNDEDIIPINNIEIKPPTGVIAPWNIKNLDTFDQEKLELLRPVVPKRRSRIQLGERASRMRDFENCMDTTLPTDYVKFKVILSMEQIILIRASRTIQFPALILKIRAKFLRNSNSCVAQLQNKLLVYKLSSSKIYQLTNEEEFVELMSLKPETVTLCWIDINRKFIAR